MGSCPSSLYPVSHSLYHVHACSFFNYLLPDSHENEKWSFTVDMILFLVSTPLLQYVMCWTSFCPFLMCCLIWLSSILLIFCIGYWSVVFFLCYYFICFEVGIVLILYNEFISIYILSNLFSGGVRMVEIRMNGATFSSKEQFLIHYPINVASVILGFLYLSDLRAGPFLILTLGLLFLAFLILCQVCSPN